MRGGSSSIVDETEIIVVPIRIGHYVCRPKLINNNLLEKPMDTHAPIPGVSGANK